MLGKKRPLGRKITDLRVGDYYSTSHLIEDKELLLYLGITGDANPLYTQHDYASQTPFKYPLVPSVLLFGIVSSIVSMHLPGPGSHILQHEIIFPQPVYHQSKVSFHVEIISVDLNEHTVAMSVVGKNQEGDKVLSGKLKVCPPYEPQSMTATSLENFN
ncbi:MaoC family dehydratase [Sediminibacillus massiliensis]|uniref:MaoC family dehydratase n=1 Tax=Sediminibacillus massiliensis TaxID=1926277 RepID=UPI0009886CD1|nr:MaoC/PaaZ C-terminal domain-containing protein [Sediminibacillus massiliensis]